MSSGMVALGVCLAVVFLALIAIGVHFLLRRRRRKGYGKRVSIARPVSDLRHPANLIVPFGSRDQDAPRFSSSYPPGANMRVAYQRSDGSWQFSEPEEQFAPSSLSDIDLEAQRRKGREAKNVTSPSSLSLVHSSKNSIDESDIVPPPAYTESEGGYLKH